MMKKKMGFIIVGFLLVIGASSTCWSQVATSSGQINMLGDSETFGVIKKNSGTYSVVAGTPIYKVATPIEQGLPKPVRISTPGKENLHEANLAVPANARAVVITGSNQMSIRGALGNDLPVTKPIQPAPIPEVSGTDHQTTSFRNPE